MHLFFSIPSSSSPTLLPATPTHPRADREHSLTHKKE